MAYGAIDVEMGSTGADEEANDARRLEHERIMLSKKVQKLCKKDPSLIAFAEEVHNLECTQAQLRQIHNLFLEPMARINKELAFNKLLDKMLSLSIMFLGTLVPMLSMFGVDKQHTVMISALVPILQGVNMNLQPNAKAVHLERVRTACQTEAHHFMSLTGEYAEAHGHDDHEIKHFLEQLQSHFSMAAKPKKKDKKKGKGGDKKDKKKKDKK